VEQFNKAFAQCHFRPNIVNLSVVSGSRFGGIAGAPTAPGAFWVSLALSDENR
jgi:hypothetical protein